VREDRGRWTLYSVNMVAGDGFGKGRGGVRLDSMGLMHCIEGGLDVYILSRIGH